jgi:hypothetical protein
MSIVARVFLILCVLAALAVGIFTPADPADPANMFGQHMGEIFVLLGFPALIAFIFAGRRKVRHPNRFVLIFCVLSGFFTLANSASLFKVETTEVRFSRLMREAAGLQPVAHKGFSRQQRFDNEVREQYRILLQQNRDYTEAIGKLDTSKMKLVGKAESFVVPETSREALDQLHAAYNLDVDEAQKVSDVMASLRHILETDASSPAEREEVLKSFDSTYSVQLSTRQQTLAAEKGLVDAVDDSHAYAKAHSASITMRDGRLMISNPAVLNEFNLKIGTQKAQREAFVKLEHEVERSQADELKKMGLTRKDVGGK